VPVTAKNFEGKGRVAEVLWEEDRLDASSPLYEGQRVVPFGFGRIDTAPGAFTFRVFDHTGASRYEQQVPRSTASAAPTRSRTRSAARLGSKAPAKPAKAKKKPAKR